MGIRETFQGLLKNESFKRKVSIVQNILILISYSVIFGAIINFADPSERLLTVGAAFAITAILFSLNEINKIFKKNKPVQESKALIEEFESRFHTHLIEALKIDAISELKDIYNIYDALSISSESHLSYMNQDKIALYLKSFLLKLYSKKFEGLSDDQVLKFKESLSAYISRLEDIMPYSDLPNAEKGLLNDIFNYSDGASKELVKQKISDLSSIILTKEDLLKQAKKDTERSTKLALIGLALTIVFGMATVYPLLY